MNNNGIQINLTEWLIRARKAQLGVQPVPRTKQLIKFYHQLSLGQKTLGGEFDIINNVLLLWDCTKDGDLTRLWVVYPLSVSVYKWRYDIMATAANKAAKSSQPFVGGFSNTQHNTGEFSLTIQTQFTKEFTLEELGDLDLEYVGENGEFDYDDTEEENTSEESNNIG
ncbi:MAG: hypothetical protein J0I20_16210 [Chloroflexi bacterium]|nr:hypothetical protein [Chloroflexota bacterium]OJV88696.1 MAG: hypothetical protein BGO39_04105 [Chloroflexi bacterium 54-19]